MSSVRCSRRLDGDFNGPEWQTQVTRRPPPRAAFSAAWFDVAFLVAVLGEVSDPTACLKSIAEVLRPEGLLVVAELPGDPDALTEIQLRALAQDSDLQFINSVRVSRSVVTTFRRDTLNAKEWSIC